MVTVSEYQFEKFVEPIYDKIDTLTSLDEESGDYVELVSAAERFDLSTRIKAQTDKAVCIDENWYAYSQLRVDMEGTLWCRDWLYRKYN